MEAVLIIALTLGCVAFGFIAIVGMWGIFNKKRKGELTQFEEEQFDKAVKVIDREGKEGEVIVMNGKAYHNFKTRQELEEAKRFAKEIHERNNNK